MRKGDVRNLIPTTALSESERRDMAVIGGKRSVEVRKSKKEMRTFVSAMTTADASNIVPDKLVTFCAEQGIYCTVENAMHAAMCLKALAKGDAMAYNAALNRLLGMPTQKVTLDGNFTNIVDPEKLKKFRQELDDGNEDIGTQ